MLKGVCVWLKFRLHESEEREKNTKSRYKVTNEAED